VFDVAFLNMRYPSDRHAHIHASWLDPVKTRRAVIVGSEKMVLYDDTSSEQQITSTTRASIAGSSPRSWRLRHVRPIPVHPSRW
jgi:hypothetical protein